MIHHRSFSAALRAILVVLIMALPGVLATGCSPGEKEGGAAAAPNGRMGAGESEGGDSADEPGGAHSDEGEGAQGGVSNRVTLSEAAFANAGIEVASASTERADGTLGGIEVPGQVEYDPARVALVSPRTSGRIERLVVVRGDRVAAGAPVAFLLSTEFLTAQSDFVRALRRARTLAGSADEEGASALASAARRRLRLLGVSEAWVHRLEAGEEPHDLLVVEAPFAGTVTEVHTLSGAAVSAGSPIATMADISVVNVVANVPENALTQLRRGQRATARFSAYPERRFDGRVERVLNELDPSTRTVRAVIRVPNTNRSLKPGMFATVRLQGSSPRAQGAASMVTIPSSAVVTEGDQRFVFVEVGPRTYERRRIELVPTSSAGLARGGSDRVIVRSGLAGGERVVVHGAFTLEAELSKGSFGEHEH